MAAYYNEFDPFAAQWLRNLIAAGHIAPGKVDERSIVEVQPDDLRGFDQCHFFAGIGVWSYALRLAGWPDDRPVWTASLPCQPFSAAGKRQGHADERHLAPVWLRLVSECRPAICFGEQVGAAIGMGWLDALFIRLEQCDYACGAVDFPAASVGAPHLRQRAYWVADAERDGGRANESWRGPERGAATGRGGPTDGVADDDRAGQLRAQEREDNAEDCERRRGSDAADSGEDVRSMADTGLSTSTRQREYGGSGLREQAAIGSAESCIMGNAIDAGSQGRERPDDMELRRGTGTDGSTATAGFWRDAEWLPCRDGKARPVEPGTSPLAHGAAQRVGRLRAYGNAIVAPQAAEFVAAYMTIETAGESPARPQP